MNNNNLPSITTSIIITNSTSTVFHSCKVEINKNTKLMLSDWNFQFRFFPWQAHVFYPEIFFVWVCWKKEKDTRRESTKQMVIYCHFLIMFLLIKERIKEAQNVILSSKKTWVGFLIDFVIKFKWFLGCLIWVKL